MLIESEVFRELGRVEEFEKQLDICDRLCLSIIGPVYKSWKPTENITKTVIDSPKLKPVSTLDLLKESTALIQSHGMVTVRQVYYLLVSMQIINNNRNEYRRVVNVIKNGRLAGLITFDSIVDDTRKAEKTPSWGSMDEIINVAINQFRSNWWRDQPRYVEVWLEKRALRRIFYPITNSNDVYLCTGGGYQSWAEVWEARKRFYSRIGGDLVILYFGDLDPSGKDMPRDIRRRFETLGFDVDLMEVALTREDISVYGLPRNPTKRMDSRHEWYRDKYGIGYGVELDALPPEVLRGKIKQAIEEYCDMDKLMEAGIRDAAVKSLWRNMISSLKDVNGSI
jgi:hypothetical protein